MGIYRLSIDEASFRAPGFPETPPLAASSLLWHVRHARNADGSVEHVDADGQLVWDEEDGDNLKILGVYSTGQLTQERIARARLAPGFADEPDCFMTDRHVMDRDMWEGGFVSIPHGDD